MENVYCHVYIYVANKSKNIPVNKAKELLNLQATACTLVSLKLPSAWVEESPRKSFAIWGFRAEKSLWDNSWVGKERSGSHFETNRIETSPSKSAKVTGSLVKSTGRAAVSSHKHSEWLQHSFKSICSAFVGYFSEFYPFYHWYR